MQNLIVFNSESAYYFFKDLKFRECVKNADALFCDSISLSIVLNIINIKHTRLHGPDFFHQYLRNKKNNSILIIGGSEKSHISLKNKYALKNAFFNHKVIDGNEIQEISDLCNTKKIQAIFVCLGLRKQEFFIDHLIKKLDYNNEKDLIIGVGAAIDFLSGNKKRAHQTVRKFGFEWLPRLIREPRMFPRIVRSLVGCFYVLIYYKTSIRDLNKFQIDCND